MYMEDGIAINPKIFGLFLMDSAAIDDDDILKKQLKDILGDKMVETQNNKKVRRI